MRRPTLLNIPGLRSSSVDERTSDGVEGGKRKWVPPDGTGGALWGTPRPVRKDSKNQTDVTKFYIYILSSVNWIKNKSECQNKILAGVRQKQAMFELSCK